MRPAVLLVVFSLSGFAGTPALPKVSNAPAITPSNPIWMASQVPLSRWGYVEEEFFIEGTANTYASLTDTPAKVTGTFPYKTRLLVRRPMDSKRFSGNVVLEPIHPSRSTPSLATDFRYVYSSGDVWVGVEPPGNIATLQQFNPTRYASLTPVDKLTVHDSLGQVAALLQSPSNPIRDLKTKDVFMQGVSATCGVVSQFIILFHRELKAPNGKAIVSGYFPSECAVLLPDLDVPVVRVNTEYDFNAKTRKADSDDPKGRYRLYELAGSAHFSTNNILFGESPLVLHGTAVTGTVDLLACKEFGPPKYAAMNDFPVWVIYDAAIKNLEEWVQKGKAPPKGERFTVDADGKAMLDANGNFKGGVRTPLVDSPTAAWYAQGTNCSLWGYKIPFSKETLEKMYPSHEAYVKQVKSQTAQMSKEGWITDEDAKYLLNMAEKSAVPEPLDASTVPMQAYYPYGTP